MSQAAATEKKKGPNWLILGAICVASVAGGLSAPMLIGSAGGGHGKKTPQAADAQPALVPFGEPIVVNLAEERLSRYLRVKLMLVVDSNEEKEVEEQLGKKKSFLKNWLLSYLSDQTLQSITGATGQNRIRRELRDQFNAMLFPDGAEKIADILFEEFTVQ